MKICSILIMIFVMLLLSVPAWAEKAPAVEACGSAQAACHLAAHLQAYTHSWDGQFKLLDDGEKVSTLAGDGCGEYGHVHCYGRRVTMWDTPKKGDNDAVYMAGTKVGQIGPETEFQLIDVCKYRKTFYALVRVYENEKPIIAGWVNADYIGCDCTAYDEAEEIPIYDSYDTFSVDG